ncbi:uncharacterized protein C8A04DRAFT_27174 [Dichotomopilus funicola]|uniref:Uncharacterized protein n=1 Tax=Dichotomopilus funicola TaxID=1934379 RepID=A0AAN6V6Y4_9PEZI|nr:hypothetical protein C8A04DRAFT_27174 [Dichotomopilus funicola]
MKHTAVLSLLAIAATAAKLPNANTRDIADVVARHNGHHQPNNTIPGDGHNRDLDKRRGGGAGGAGGAHSSGAGGAHGGGANTSSHSGTSGASVLMSLDVGLLVAGVAGAGVGAIFL